MKLGAHTFGFVWQCGPEEAFDQLAGIGISNVQLMATAPHFDPFITDVPRTNRMRAALARNGQTALALDLSSADVNLASPSYDVRRFAVDAYARAIARAAGLGMPWVCIGSGRRHGLLPQVNVQLMDPFRAVFADLHREADRQGVKLILENHPHGLLYTAEQMRDFLDAEGYTDVPVIYDVANAAFVGEDPVAGLAVLGGKVKIIHLSDAPSTRWGHDPIGSGDIDFARIGAAVQNNGYQDYVVLEILSDHPLGDLADGIAKLRGMGWAF
jgi:deoxyribonuclease-4